MIVTEMAVSISNFNKNELNFIEMVMKEFYMEELDNKLFNDLRDGVITKTNQFKKFDCEGCKHAPPKYHKSNNPCNGCARIAARLTDNYERDD